MISIATVLLSFMFVDLGSRIEVFSGLIRLAGLAGFQL